jgi:DNA-binding CsgD family transcriptional regulator
MDETLLDKIYEAASIPQLWENVLEQISSMAGGHAGALIAIRNGDMPKYVVTKSYGGEAFHQVFKTGISQGNVRPGRALVKYPMGFSTDLELCSLQELAEDPIYQIGLKPNGFEWTAGTAIPVPSGDIMMFDIARRTGTGPFERAEMEVLDRYRPHLARAALMSARLELAEANAATAALQRVGLPAASVSASGKIVVANSLFESLAPRIRTGAFNKLEVSDHSLHARLMRSLESNSAVIRSIPIAATADYPALVVHMLPVRRAANDIFAQSSAVMIVTPVEAPAAPLTALLTGLFDLTPAEARIAASVASGQTVQEMAVDYGVSPETVRTQLKTVFNKTGTTRQTTLALLLSGVGRVAGSI